MFTLIGLFTVRCEPRERTTIIQVCVCLDALSIIPAIY